MSLADNTISEVEAKPSAATPAADAPKASRARKTSSTSRTGTTRTPARRGRPPKAVAEQAPQTETPEQAEKAPTTSKAAASSSKSTARSTAKTASQSAAQTEKSESKTASKTAPKTASKSSTASRSTSTRRSTRTTAAKKSAASQSDAAAKKSVAPQTDISDTVQPLPETAPREATAASAGDAEAKPAPKRRGRRPKVVVDASTTPQDNQIVAAARMAAEALMAGDTQAAAHAVETAETPAQPKASKPVSRTSARRSKAAASAADQADASQAHGVVPESVPPQATKAEAAKPEAAKTEAATQDVAKSEGKADAAIQDAAKPDAAKPEGKADYEYVSPDMRPGRSARSKHVSSAKTDSRRGPKSARDSRDNRDSRDRRSQDTSHRRQRRAHASVTREPVVPKTTAEDLAKLKVAELREKAEELTLDVKGLKKAELVEKVLEASIKAEGFVEVEGILDVLQDGYGFLRTSGYLPGENDVYVGLSVIRRNGLRKGDFIKGQVRPARDNEKYAALQQIITVNDVPVEELGRRVRFGDLTPIFPDDMLQMEHGKNTITARVIDLVAPIGKGQRGLIVSPPKAGKTTILKDIAASITTNNPEVHLMCLLVDERPEEVTDMQRSIKGEVIASTFDMPIENHIAVSELVIERAKRLVENGGDVVILLDSLTRLARAYNLAQPASGRILSGGVDSTALYPPKRFLGAARNIEGGGSLTILASALIETGSKMDEVIFEEFKGTGNMELKLDRYLADRRIFPAIDPITSGTRKEELLLDPQEATLIWGVRRVLANVNSTDRAMQMLIKSLKQTNTNEEFLIRSAKKAQKDQHDNDVAEL